MESKLNYKYYQIIKKIKEFFECKYHTNNNKYYKYTAYCSTCKLNICDKCLNNNKVHVGHTIYFFDKIMPSEKQVKYYRTIYYLCTFYLKSIREIVIELLSDLIDIIKNENNPENFQILLNKKSQLKNSYKYFYKMNNYQMHYARNNLEIFVYCKKWKYINYQIIKNIYNIKLNSVKLPDLEEKNIFHKVETMINFLKNYNNNILRDSDSEHPSTFYSYIDYSTKNPKVNTYTVRLCSLLFDNNKGEVYDPSNNGVNNKAINDIRDSISSIETSHTENNKEIENFDLKNIEKNIWKNLKNEYNIYSIQNENENINNIKDIKEKENKEKKEKKDKAKKDEDLKKINYRINILKENLSNYNNIIKNNSIIEINEKEYNNNQNMDEKICEDIEYYIEPEKKKNINNINITNYIKKGNHKIEIKNTNNIIQNENLKAFIYKNLPKTCDEEVEYRENIQYKYLDKIRKKEINCQYYGEFKKGTFMRHGRGLFLWEDGEKYLGYWANDKREGEGKNIYPNGNEYKGGYKNGKKEGDGVYKWRNGDQYKGNWKNDMKDGKGVYEFSNGDIYDGFFKMDKIDGKGCYTWANNITFKGKFKNNSIDKSCYINSIREKIIDIKTKNTGKKIIDKNNIL